MTLELDPRISALITAGAGPMGSPAFSAFRVGDAATLRTVLDDVSTELHVRPGLPHAFDVLLLGDEDGRRSLADKTRALGRI